MSDAPKPSMRPPKQKRRSLRVPVDEVERKSFVGSAPPPPQRSTEGSQPNALAVEKSQPAHPAEKSEPKRPSIEALRDGPSTDRQAIPRTSQPAGPVLAPPVLPIGSSFGWAGSDGRTTGPLDRLDARMLDGRPRDVKSEPPPRESSEPRRSAIPPAPPARTSQEPSDPNRPSFDGRPSIDAGRPSTDGRASGSHARPSLADGPTTGERARLFAPGAVTSAAPPESGVARASFPPARAARPSLFEPDPQIEAEIKGEPTRAGKRRSSKPPFESPLDGASPNLAPPSLSTTSSARDWPDEPDGSDITHPGDEPRESAIGPEATRIADATRTAALPRRRDALDGVETPLDAVEMPIETTDPGLRIDTAGLDEHASPTSDPPTESVAADDAEDEPDPIPPSAKDAVVVVSPVVIIQRAVIAGSPSAEPDKTTPGGFIAPSVTATEPRPTTDTPPETRTDDAASDEPVIEFEEGDRRSNPDIEALDEEELVEAPAPQKPPPARPKPPPSGEVDLGRPTQKRKAPQWYEELFNDDYLRTVPVPSSRVIKNQCDFIEQRLGLPPGSTILDVGCGLGLHAIELTRRGYVVVGLDFSLPMLSRAADEAQDHGFKLNFLHGDMREMNFEGAFDAILCWGTTFGYFDDDANRTAIERMHRALKPGGLLFLDVVNRDYVVPNQPNLVWFEGEGCVVMEETSFNFITSRLIVKRNVILDDNRQRENQYSLRLYSLHELGMLLHHRGFRVVEVSGREATPGVYFGADSPRLMILAERRVQGPPAAPPAPPKRMGSSPPPPDDDE